MGQVITEFASQMKVNRIALNRASEQEECADARLCGATPARISGAVSRNGRRRVMMTPVSPSDSLLVAAEAFLDWLTARQLAGRWEILDRTNNRDEAAGLLAAIRAKAEKGGA